MIFVKCKSIYRCMSRAKCQKSLRDFDKLKQSPQIDFAAALDLCVLFVCAVLFSGQAKNLSGVPHLTQRREARPPHGRQGKATEWEGHFFDRAPQSQK